MELALEGERLCKGGDCRTGAAFFEAAVRVGTDDLKTLSAIYSQLGNAYFYLQEYGKALEYHKHDLNLARYVPQGSTSNISKNWNIGLWVAIVYSIMYSSPSLIRPPYLPINCAH